MCYYTDITLCKSILGIDKDVTMGNIGLGYGRFKCLSVQLFNALFSMFQKYQQSRAFSLTLCNEIWFLPATQGAGKTVRGCLVCSRLAHNNLCEQKDNLVEKVFPK